MPKVEPISPELEAKSENQDEMKETDDLDDAADDSYEATDDLHVAADDLDKEVTFNFGDDDLGDAADKSKQIEPHESDDFEDLGMPYLNEMTADDTDDEVTFNFWELLRGIVDDTRHNEVQELVLNHFLINLPEHLMWPQSWPGWMNPEQRQDGFINLDNAARADGSHLLKNVPSIL